MHHYTATVYGVALLQLSSVFPSAGASTMYALHVSAAAQQQPVRADVAALVHLGSAQETDSRALQEFDMRSQQQLGLYIAPAHGQPVQRGVT